ncbi:AraC family transcriptional regulator [Actinoplanes sp. NPDC023714]|uniref:helix-turn-helix transcriptional regulator n=1 Tax=Actinoplanes sp. NPDC023714 TaxID=3154322 RepID=UPI00340689F6
MPAITSADTAPAYTLPDWAGISGCALPVTAGAVTGLLTHHALLLTVSGPVIAEVDFTVHRCEPGTLLWIRPGQAVRIEPGDHETATAVFRPGLFRQDELPGLEPDHPGGPARTPVPLGEVARETGAALARIRQDAAGPPGDAAAALLRHQLAALLLRLLLLDPGPEAPGHVETRTFERFRARLEEGYPNSRRVEDYAGELGCSVRTLTRASLAITGRTAKQVVDDRVALQARRLLAATGLSVAEVGRSLGFAEPTNFGRFFHRETGLSPGQFRGNFVEDHPGGIPGQRPPSD